ncbi:cysteine peptidase family C39 domain-containing protein [Lutispora saccharofermentans]|uniref:Butirosin biosynthesis protein H N-terminal domain-containing protein n=1 Tax=Lutispora saccharofermentans TaxID=3024236 RepID=A0ABT1NIP2_9FIRM|nr:hypothetical protein [Lutispora saccharofermentans]MCQ1531140.1 hypothetical protein [Lutispora saccharofermentans]
MLLDIKPLHNEAWSCLEDIIISSVDWWSYRYEMMFSEAWDFQFVCDGDKKKTEIGSRLHEGHDNTWSLLEKYHGIHINATGMLGPSAINDIICTELHNRHPTILYINAYNCPWIGVYHKSHFSHTCLVIGNDEKNEAFICIDPYTTKNEQFLPYRDFYEGSTQCAIFRNAYKSTPQINWKDVINQTVSKFFCNTYSDSPISKMLLFSDEIRQCLDLNDETAGNDDLLKTPLFERLKYLGRRRIQYSQMLCYLNEKYGLPNINEVQFGLQVASQNWSITRSMLIKMYYTQEWKASRLKVADKIRDNAAYEQSLIMKLQNTIK